MSVLLLTADLLGASRVEGEARKIGIDLLTVPNAAAVVEGCVRQPVALVMVDPATAGLDVATLVQQLKSRTEQAPEIVAFGPHVHEALLGAAEEAGCDQVLSRGQFLAQVDAILARHSTAT